MSISRAVHMRGGLLAALLAGFQVSVAQAQTQRVKDTVHNLSVSGPGTIRAVAESEVCVFCHTPHGAGGVTPLWNRRLSQGPYQIYQSTSLRANVQQPTGSSKLCLSCHDGTIALGSVLSRSTPIAMSGGVDRLPPGPSSLGTDLSDDHPISFVYPSAVAGSGLVAAQALPAGVKLDQGGELQCASCHEPHDNSYGKFLVRSNASSALCRTCHIPEGWTSSIHATSGVAVPEDIAAALGADATSTAQNACKSCHQAHGAGSHQWLLHLQNISATCIPCHRGRMAPGNIELELSKLSTHGIRTLGPIADIGGSYLEGSALSCADCHNPHATGSTEGGSASLPASLARVPGATLNGVMVPAISQEHELCFRCHGDSPVRLDTIASRVILQPNKRLQFQPTNPSFHPVGNPGNNAFVPSLLPPLTTASTIQCGDCHASDDTRALGGQGPKGPHGSSFSPLLAQRCDTFDNSVESPSAYALCYRCHQRDSILSDASFHEHRKHIVEERTPCSVCHDPHGISSAQGTPTGNSHLINFDRTIVFPNGSGRLEFNDLGFQHGQCYLSCHGEDHNPESY